LFCVSGRYVQYGKQINEKDPNLAQEIRDGKKSITEAINQINKAERISKIKRNAKKYKVKNNVQIVCADFYQWCEENLKDNSIDLIMTEPPCTKKDLPLCVIGSDRIVCLSLSVTYDASCSDVSGKIAANSSPP